MSHASLAKNPRIPISLVVEQIDIQGQYIQLAAPIRLSGQLNPSALESQYALQTGQRTALSALQIGVDEAGRGPLLGSVHVAATILPAAWSGLIEAKPLKDTPLSILTDSKKLSEKKRDMLYPLVQQHAVGYLIADVPAAVIDQLNILQATMLGMRLCAQELLAQVARHLDTAVRASHTALAAQTVDVLFDGNRCPELDSDMLEALGIPAAVIDSQAWIKGDGRHTSIAAASILAKVSRDNTMYALDAQYPNYGIAKHKGYPTQAHMAAIDRYGVLDTHRRSFAPVKKALAAQGVSSIKV